MTPLIRLEQVGNAYKVYYENGVLLGMLDFLEDGYLYFWPEPGSSGCWGGPVLQQIAEELERLNKPWDEQIRNDPALNQC